VLDSWWTFTLIWVPLIVVPDTPCLGSCCRCTTRKKLQPSLEISSVEYKPCILPYGLGIQDPNKNILNVYQISHK
jgi:hypothetical protein